MAQRFDILAGRSYCESIVEKDKLSQTLDNVRHELVELGQGIISSVANAVRNATTDTFSHIQAQDEE